MITITVTRLGRAGYYRQLMIEINLQSSILNREMHKAVLGVPVQGTVM